MRTFYQYLGDNTFDLKLKQCARLTAELNIEDPISAFIEANRETMPNLEMILLEAAPTGFGAVPQGPSPWAAAGQGLWGGIKKAAGAVNRNVIQPFQQANAARQQQQSLRGLEDKYQNAYKILNDLKASLIAIPQFKTQITSINNLFDTFLQSLDKQHKELSAYAVNPGSGPLPGMELTPAATPPGTSPAIGSGYNP